MTFFIQSRQNTYFILRFGHQILRSFWLPMEELYGASLAIWAPESWDLEISQDLKIWGWLDLEILRYLKILRFGEVSQDLEILRSWKWWDISRSQDLGGYLKISRSWDHGNDEISQDLKIWGVSQDLEIPPKSWDNEILEILRYLKISRFGSPDC